MGYSKGSITTVQIPILYDTLEKKDRIRFRQILGRDKRIIKRYLGIIQTHEKDIVEKSVKKKSKGIKYKINVGKLDELTATTKSRSKVAHDLKKEFPRVSLNELKECRDSAVGSYLSYLERGDKGKKPGSRLGKFNRSIGYRRFSIDKKNKILSIIDSMDTNPRMIRRGKSTSKHNQLRIPLRFAQYFRREFDKGEVKSVRIFKKRKQYFAAFSIKSEVRQFPYKHDKNQSKKEVGVLSLDLGIKNAICCVLLTSHGISQHRFIGSARINNTIKSYEKFRNRIKKIQQEASLRKSSGLNADGLYKLLRKLSEKRSTLRQEIDHQLTAELVNYVHELSVQYDLFIGLGKLKGIRNKQRKGNGNKYLRKIIHEWSFARISEMLKYKLTKMGYKRRFVLVDEYFTSIYCWKCGEKGQRPKQSYFKCQNPDCRWQGNADINGAVNIGKRAIKYFKLTKIIKIGVRVLGFAKPKAISAGNGSTSPLGTVSVIQGNLEDYFESDQLIEKIKEKPSLMILPTHGEGEADRKPFSDEKRLVSVKSNLTTVTSGTRRGT